MKIANIILTSENGGAEQVFIDYCSILKNKLNHQVLAIVKNDAPYIHKLNELNIETKTTSNNFGYLDLLTINNIKKYLIEFDADIVLTHAGRSCTLAKLAIKKIKHKKVFHIAVNHSMNVKRSIGADIVISVNKPIFYKTIDAGQAENRSFVIHNGIDLEGFCFTENKIDFSHKKTITLGAIGRLVEPKNFMATIKMMAILKNLEHKYHKKFILRIAGDGEYKSELENAVKKLNLENEIKFVGWVSDIKNFFNNVDIFIMPSLRETFGLVVLEAMKYQKPIISSDADGPKEILRDNKDGLIVSLENKEFELKLAEAVIKIIEDSDLANKMVASAKTRLEDKFSLKAVEKSLSEIIPFAK